MKLHLLRFIARRMAYNASHLPYDFWKTIGDVPFQVLVNNELLNVDIKISEVTDQYLRLCIAVDDGTEPFVTIPITAQVDLYADRDEAFTPVSLLSLNGSLSEFSVYGWEWESPTSENDA